MLVVGYYGGFDIYVVEDCDGGGGVFFDGVGKV